MTLNFCAKCGEPRAAGMGFCAKCGQAFAAPPAPPFIAAPPAPPHIVTPPDRPHRAQTTDGSFLRTILLGSVLAIGVVLFGGPATEAPSRLGLSFLIVAPLVVFDLWRQQRRKEADARGEVRRPAWLSERSAAYRSGVVVLALVIITVALFVVMKLVGGL